MTEGRNDRRQFGAIRIPAQLRVEISEAVSIQTQTVNVSQNGVLLAGPLPKELDDFIRLKIYLPPSQTPIEVLGRVARKFSKIEKECFGIQFIEMESSAQNTWLEYISRVESMTIAQGALTSTSHLLQERKASGRISQSLVFRFESQETLLKFLSDFESEQGYFIPVPLMKSIGERIDLVLVRPKNDTMLEVEAEVLAAQGQFPSAERMGLKIKMISTPEKKSELNKFIE